MVSPINWLITGFVERSTGLNKQIIVKTDIEVYLTCFVSLTDPEPHLVVRYQRGVRTWCTTKPAKVLWMKYPQTEYTDTIYHTFMLPGPLLNLKHWIRFEGTFLGISTISNSPIFKRTERTYWEPWDKGFTGYHPWSPTTGGGGIIFVQDGLLRMRSYTNWIGGERCFVRVGWPVSPRPLISPLPHYCLTKTQGNTEVSNYVSYLEIYLGTIYGYFWHLFYYFVCYPNTPALRFSGVDMHKVVGHGEHVFDLHADRDAIAAFRGWNPPTGQGTIFGLEVNSWRYAYSLPALINVDQDYIDFLPELPD